jgi:ribosomal RNA-processing protein 8
VIGDFGCGEGLLQGALPGVQVIGIDHVACNETVIACDMAHTPLADGALDAVVFSLSLMGANWRDYLVEKGGQHEYK